jgi:hypothetical protein
MNKFMDMNESQLEILSEKNAQAQETTQRIIAKLREEGKEIDYALAQKRIDRPFDAELGDEIDDDDFESGKVAEMEVSR